MTLAGPFLEGGYVPKGEYAFPEKKLLARHFEHPGGHLPKVFISELKVGELPEDIQRTIKTLIDQAPADLAHRPDFPVAGRTWKLSSADYETLRVHSEYAAWMAAWGFRANHFTVLVNALTTFKNLAELNSFLKENAFKLNSSGGEIKGSAEVLLEQSSTLADQGEVRFTDGTHKVPACYYEFARRFPMPSGQLYGGFVEKSADKIFESTDKRNK